MRNLITRNPLLVRGALALIVMGLARLGVALDVIPAEWNLDEARVEQIFDFVIAAWAWFAARSRVTPVADPRDAFGRELVAINTQRPRSL